jgi:hypothetical protein
MTGLEEDPFSDPVELEDVANAAPRLGADPDQVRS